MAHIRIWRLAPVRIGVAFICALAVSPLAVKADGGRDPGDAVAVPRSSSPPAAPAPTPAPAPAPARVAPRTPPAVAPPPRQVRQRRAPVFRIVETAPSGLPPVGETRFLSNEVIVRFRLSSTEAGRSGAIAGLGLTHLDARTFVLAGVTVHRYRLPAGLPVQDAISRLEASAAVVNAQPNYLYTIQQGQAAAKLPQFGNDRIGLAGAHARSRGSGTRIAVIDTAVDISHPELEGAELSVADVTGSDTPADPHGTSIVGILAARAKLTGVAPESDILAIAAFAKGTEGEPVGDSWTILEATNVAYEARADILNLSFAGPADPLLERAMRGARRLDILTVAAAGNAGPQAEPLYPAAYDPVIAVTATDAQDMIYSSANRGDYIDMSAPGVGLVVLGDASGFRTSSGTSMAAAHVSGIAALFLAANPGADLAEVLARLEASASDLGAPGKDGVFGAGLVSAAGTIGGLMN